MSAPGRTVAVVGSSVAAVMAALSLAERNWRVTLVTTTSRLGGHFGGLTLGGHAFDAGMVFLEFTSFNAERDPDVSSYDPAIRNDAGRFVGVVEQTLAAFGTWRTVETPRMRLGANELPDLLIANDLTSIAGLPAEQRARMRDELRDVPSDPRGPLHPSRKTTDPAFEQLDLRTVSLANHGSTFHETFMEQFCVKMTGNGTAALLARYHRLAWLPLYYPETLLRALDGEPPSLAETRFSYPVNGSVSGLIQGMTSRLREHPNVTVLTASVVGVSTDDHRTVLNLSNNDVIVTDRLVWGAEPDTLLACAGEDRTPPLERASVTLASILVRREALRTMATTLLVPQDTSLPFRVTNQSMAAGDLGPISRVSCEWNSAFLPDLAVPPAEAATQALQAMNIITDDRAVTDARVDVFRDALVLPTSANRDVVTARTRMLAQRFPAVPCIGPAAPFGASSLNDQIIQGLKVAKELETAA